MRLEARPYGLDEQQRRNKSAEHITIVFGYYDLFTSGYFCKIEKEGICVEDFGPTERAALKYARKAWKKESARRYQKKYCYPKVLNCEEG